MSLEQAYSIHLINVSAQQPATEIYNRVHLSDRENWFEALAALELAIQSFPENKQNAIALFDRLFDDGLDFKASFDLDQSDYTFYRHKVGYILGNLANVYPEAYIEIAFQYKEARRGFNSDEKSQEYLHLALKAGVPSARAVLAYFYYYGITVEKDQQKAEQLFAGDHSNWSLLYQAYTKLNRNELDTLPTDIKQLKESEDKKVRKNAFLLEGSYLEALGKVDEALVAFKAAYEAYHAPFALTRFAYIKWSLDPTESKHEVLHLWKEAASYGSIEAFNYLGTHTFPETQEAPNYEETIQWFSFGHLYQNTYSTYRLALIFLYVDGWKDQKKGFAYLDEAIEKGSTDAMIEKAEMYVEGTIATRDYSKAFALFQHAATEKGLPYADVRLGYLYEIGAGPSGEKEPAMALSHYEQAVEKDHPYGFSNAGRMYRYGLAGSVDNEKAKLYFEKGVEQNVSFSMTELAFMYEDGTLEQDYQKAFELFKRAAEADGAYAIYCYGKYLQNGYHDGKKRPEEAFVWFKKGAAFNETNCIYEMGRCYRYGLGVEENPDEAIHYYQLSTEAGFPQGMVELALCYEYEYGVPFDAQKILDLMLQAAEQHYAFAQYKVGIYYMHGSLGEQVPIDADKALSWLNKAIDNGYPYALIEVGNYYLWDYDGIDQADKGFEYFAKALEHDIVAEGLGVCYEFGIGVEESISEAFKCYEMAANHQVVGAMYRLGNCYLYGNGVKEQADKAFEWFTNAAQQGNVPAQYQAGLCLLKGIGTAMDKEEGLHWLSQAAEQNYAAAQYEMGNCFLMGDGLDENEDTAMYWFEQAAEKGHDRALKIVGRTRR